MFHALFYQFEYCEFLLCDDLYSALGLEYFWIRSISLRLIYTSDLGYGAVPVWCIPPVLDGIALEFIRFGSVLDQFLSSSPTACLFCQLTLWPVHLQTRK